jgi:phage terminase large subunit
VSTLALAQAQIASYREPPYGACKFAVEQLGFHPDPWQEKVLVAFCDPRQRRISLQACAGPGKSAATAVCGWYFLSTQCTPGEHPKGLATSITGDNLRDNLWTEFAKWQGRSPFLQAAFTWSSRRIFAKDHPETWFLAARSWPKSGSADEQGRTFSGLHGRNVAVFVDESGAIPATVLRAGEQALPNTIFGKLMQSGNPISLEGMLYEAANRLRDQWTIIIVNGDPDDPESWVNSPRVRAQQNPDEEDMSAAAMNRKQIETYGRDNPWVMSYILGQFPKSSLNSLLGIEDVQAAMTRHLQPDAYTWSQKRLGVDVARFGDDRSVIFARQGLNGRVGKNNPIVMRVANTTDIAARVAMSIAKWHAEGTYVDDTGHWGHGVYDNLTTAGLPVVPINFAGKAIDARYRNRRAEMWLSMAEWVKGGAALPNVAELVAELTTPTYTFLNGQFLLEEKDQIKKRLGRSPDLADALALTFALPDMPADLAVRLGIGAAGAAGTNGHALTDYDPMARG